MKKLLSIVLALSLCLTAMMGCFVVSAETNAITAGDVEIVAGNDAVVTFTLATEGISAAMVEIAYTDLDLKAIGYANAVGTEQLTVEFAHSAEVYDSEGKVTEDFTKANANDTIKAILNVGDILNDKIDTIDIVLTFNAPATGKYVVNVAKIEAATAGTYDATAGWTDEEALITINADDAAANVVVIAPCDHTEVTYTDNGDGTHTSACANEACTGGFVPATEPHNYVDGECVCGAIEKFNFAGTNMTLGNSLALNFFINKSDITTTGNYIQIRKTYADGTEDDVVTYPQEEWGTQGSSMYRVNFTGMYAMHMGDMLYATVYNSDGVAISNVKEESIQSYALKAINQGANNMKTVAVDMLIYGAAAQLDFKYDEDNLVSAVLTEAQRAYATTDVSIVNSQVKELNVYGSNCTLGSRILLNSYFMNVDKATSYAMISFTTFEGKSENYRIEGSEFKNAGSNYGPVVDKLYVADARQPVTIEVYNADGELIGKCIDSVESYCARAIANGVDTNGLYTAIMKFAQSSYNLLIG